MIHLDALAAAHGAVAANPARPATAVLLDRPGLRLVVFRLEPGQAVAPHVNDAQVVLTVLEGHGLLAGEDGEVAAGPGTVVAYAPRERHGMRAVAERCCLLAAIVR